MEYAAASLPRHPGLEPESIGRQARGKRFQSLARHSREGGNPFIQASPKESQPQRIWIPAFAGMTEKTLG
ncbi:MAG: hypothetical protein BGN95_12540 [Sphingomonas sp. 66-10]|nr:MAG: hypothetical protein BGN95_12540 [Sphingomonas sp. 66-10]